MKCTTNIYHNAVMFFLIYDSIMLYYVTFKSESLILQDSVAQYKHILCTVYV